MQLPILREVKHSQQASPFLWLWPQDRHRPVTFVLASKRNSPSPDRYTLHSDFDGSPKKGLTIGFSREDCKSVSIFSQTANPGPGNYNLHRENVKDMTMSPKLKFPSLWSSSIAPGPGACTSLFIQTKQKRSTRTELASSPNTVLKTASRFPPRVLRSKIKSRTLLAQEPITLTYPQPASRF